MAPADHISQAVLKTPLLSSVTPWPPQTSAPLPFSEATEAAPILHRAMEEIPPLLTNRVFYYWAVLADLGPL